MLVPLSVQTLIMSHAPAPSILVLQPKQETDPHQNGRVLPIWMGTQEAAQIGLALEQIKLPRPLTDDLLLNALASLDAYVDHVLIHDVQKAIFYSKVVLRHHGHLIELDSRPSDAVTLALRQNASLYVTEEVLARASFPYLFRGEQGVNEEELSEFHSFVAMLSPDDFKTTDLTDLS